jgi:hypothetical protein
MNLGKEDTQAKKKRVSLLSGLLVGCSPAKKKKKE